MTTFPTLLASYLPRVHRAALGLLGDEQEAREVAQEALAKAYAAREAYDPERPFYPWLYRIVRNTALDARAKRRPVSGLDAERVASVAPDALDALSQAEAIAAVRRALERVSEEHREILAMRHFQDLSYAEIGELLGLPEGTVMSRLFRARRALARVLEEER